MRWIASLLIVVSVAVCSGVTSGSGQVRKNQARQTSNGQGTPTVSEAISSSGRIPSGVYILSELPAWKYTEVEWGKDSRRFLYTGSTKDSGVDPGLVQLLDIGRPDEPKTVTKRPGRSVVWSLDEKMIAYTSPRVEADRTVETIYVQELATGQARDVLPGRLAIHGPSTMKKLHGWIDPDTLAYEEHRGTSVQQLFLLEIGATELFTSDELLATSFQWTQAGDRVAGQWYGGPARFWLWDRRDKAFVKSDQPLPGQYQWFETWSPDGRFALFTAWDAKGWYGHPGARPTLYKLDVNRRRFEKLAEDAALATWSGEYIAYVKFEANLTLVVLNAANDKIMWTEDIGSPGELQHAELPWGYRPAFAGPYISYRTSNNQWRVADPIRQQVRIFYEGT